MLVLYGWLAWHVWIQVSGHLEEATFAVPGFVADVFWPLRVAPTMDSMVFYKGTLDNHRTLLLSGHRITLVPELTHPLTPPCAATSGSSNPCHLFLRGIHPCLVTLPQDPYFHTLLTQS